VIKACANVRELVGLSLVWEGEKPAA